MAERRAYHASADPRFLDRGRYLACVASVETAVKNDRTLTDAALRVALYIVGCWRGAEAQQQRYCHPPAEKVAADLDLSLRAVMYAIDALKRADYFRVHRGSKRRQQANRYFPRQQQAPAVAKEKKKRLTAAEQQELDDAAEGAAIDAAYQVAWAGIRQAFEQHCEAAGIPCNKLPGWDSDTCHNYLIDDIGRRSAPVTRADILGAWRGVVREWSSLFGDKAKDVLDEIEAAELF